MKVAFSAKGYAVKAAVSDSSVSGASAVSISKSR
jgi:hypothetical protein